MLTNNEAETTRDKKWKVVESEDCEQAQTNQVDQGRKTKYSTTSMEWSSPPASPREGIGKQVTRDIVATLNQTPPPNCDIDVLEIDIED